MTAKTDEEKQKLRAAGKLLAEIVHKTIAKAVPGVTGAELDLFVEEQTKAAGAVPIFLNYQSSDSDFPYPAALCVSINDEIVHNIPNEEYAFKEGDVVSLDFGLSLDGYVADCARTIIVDGKGTADDERLVDATREALDAAIRAVKAGGHVGDIGAAVSAVAEKRGLTVVKEFGGHGVGTELHEEPYIANYGKKGQGEELEEGMVIAIEPIFTLGTGEIKMYADGWTCKTRDGKNAAHFEDTIMVTANGAEILTRTFDRKQDSTLL